MWQTLPLSLTPYLITCRCRVALTLTLNLKGRAIRLRLTRVQLWLMGVEIATYLLWLLSACLLWSVNATAAGVKPVLDWWDGSCWITPRQNVDILLAFIALWRLGWALHLTSHLYMLTYRCFRWAAFISQIIRFIYVLLLWMEYLTQILRSVVALSSYRPSLSILLLISLIALLL